MGLSSELQISWASLRAKLNAISGLSLHNFEDSPGGEDREEAVLAMCFFRTSSDSEEREGSATFYFNGAALFQVPDQDDEADSWETIVSRIESHFETLQRQENDISRIMDATQLEELENLVELGAERIEPGSVAWADNSYDDNRDLLMVCRFPAFFGDTEQRGAVYFDKRDHAYFEIWMSDNDCIEDVKGNWLDMLAKAIVHLESLDELSEQFTPLLRELEDLGMSSLSPGMDEWKDSHYSDLQRLLLGGWFPAFAGDDDGHGELRLYQNGEAYFQLGEPDDPFSEEAKGAWPEMIERTKAHLEDLPEKPFDMED